MSRPTFVIQVVPEEHVAMVENVRTGERVRVDELTEIAVQLRRWLAESERASGEEASAPTAAG